MSSSQRRTIIMICARAEFCPLLAYPAAAAVCGGGADGGCINGQGSKQAGRQATATTTWNTRDRLVVNRETDGLMGQMIRRAGV